MYIHTHTKIFFKCLQMSDKFFKNRMFTSNIITEIWITVIKDYGNSK